MTYFDIITTPSKKSCKIPEIKNRQYRDLLKFTQSDSYSLFFEYLDDIIKNGIPDFDDYNIIDKAYIYLAICFLSVKSSIVIKSRLIDTEEIPLSRMMDNIEEIYNDNYFVYKVNDSMSLKIGWPTRIEIDEHIAIDYPSGIYAIIQNDTEYVLNKKEREVLVKKLPLAVLADIEMNCIDKLSVQCKLYSAIDGSSFTTDLISPMIFYTVFQVYKDNLDNFYTNMYSAIHYLKMTYADFNEITPNELTVLFHIMIKDSEEQKKKMEEESKQHNPGNTIGGRTGDSMPKFMGGL